MAKPVLNTKAIRQDVVARLVAAGVAGGKVYDSRFVRPEVAEMPFVSVVSGDCQPERWGDAALSFRRTEDLVISGMVGFGPGCDTDAQLAENLDNLEAAMFSALFADGQWLSAFEKTPNVRITKSYDVSSAKRIAAVDMRLSMRFVVQYPVTINVAPFKCIAVTTEPTTPEGADVSTRFIGEAPP